MQFWVLEPAMIGKDQGSWWTLILSRRAESFGEESWWEVFRGNRPPPPMPAPFQLGDMCLKKSQQADVMYTDLLGISFSARMAELLIDLHCTGFSPQPSEIYDKSDCELLCADAKWTQFVRGCGPVDDSTRGFNAAHPFRGTVGLFFDVSTWTGLDMFKPYQHPVVVITDRIAQAILQGSFKGYTLERVEEYGTQMVRTFESVSTLIAKHRNRPR